MSPAEQHGKAVKLSNDKRMAELIKQIKAAGVADQVAELFFINNSPDKAYTERING